jgi:VanZ family protein
MPSTEPAASEGRERSAIRCRMVPQSMSRRLPLTVLLGYLAFVIYQSLAAGGAWQCGGALLSTTARLSRSDLLANVVAYVPLGVLFLLACTRPGQSWQRLVRAGVAGALCAAGLSLAMELAQSCQPARVSSLYDSAANVGGAVIGLGLGVLLRVAPAVGAAAGTAWARDADARLRLLAVAVSAGWIVSQTMPWVFAVDVGTVRSNLSFLRRLGDGLSLDAWHIVRHAGAWAAIACAWRLAVDDRRLAAGAVVLTGVVSLWLQVLLDSGSPLSFEELAGMGIAMGVALPLVFRGLRGRAGLWARGLFWCALVSVAAYQLRPDPFAPAATQAFSLWPRVGLGSLKGAIDYALLFGWFGLATAAAAHWAARAGSTRARTLWPGLAVLTMLALEIAQTRIPGRGPDVSAPLFTLFAVLAVAAIVWDRAPSASKAAQSRWRR